MRTIMTQELLQISGGANEKRENSPAAAMSVYAGISTVSTVVTLASGNTALNAAFFGLVMVPTLSFVGAFSGMAAYLYFSEN